MTWHHQPCNLQSSTPALHNRRWRPTAAYISTSAALSSRKHAIIQNLLRRQREPLMLAVRDHAFLHPSSCWCMDAVLLVSCAVCTLLTWANASHLSMQANYKEYAPQHVRVMQPYLPTVAERCIAGIASYQTHVLRAETASFMIMWEVHTHRAARRCASPPKLYL